MSQIENEYTNLGTHKNKNSGSSGTGTNDKDGESFSYSNDKVEVDDCQNEIFGPLSKLEF